MAAYTRIPWETVRPSAVGKQNDDKRYEQNMHPEEYLLASHAIHIEMGRLSERLLELARFRCAEPSNQVFLNIMNRHAELLAELADMHDRASAGFRTSSARMPL
ncbi:MAG: hypothetical protein VW475_13245 [Curvibacter sp.]